MPFPALALALALRAAAPEAVSPAAPAGPAAPTVAPAVLRVFPYAPEERMDYSIDYLGIPMGKARISVGTRAGALLPVFLEAKTTGLLSVVNVREQLASWLDGDTGLPHASQLDAVEPGYRHVDTVRFDRADNRATVRERGKFDNTYEIDVPPGALDFVAMVFRLRTLPLAPGDHHEFQVLAGRKVSRVVAEVVGRETVDTPAGKFPSVKVRVPTGFTGKFSEKDPTFVWFSDDDRRVVLRISTDFAIGRATASLVSYRPGRPTAD